MFMADSAIHLTRIERHAGMSLDAEELIRPRTINISSLRGSLIHSLSPSTMCPIKLNPASERLRARLFVNVGGRGEVFNRESQ